MDDAGAVRGRDDAKVRAMTVVPGVCDQAQ
jgi:hypothetical protein